MGSENLTLLNFVQHCVTQDGTREIRNASFETNTVNIVVIKLICIVMEWTTGLTSGWFQHSGIEIWARPITPIYQNYYSYALAFVNRRVDGTPSDIAVTLQELELYNPGGYVVEVNFSSSLFWTALSVLPRTDAFAYYITGSVRRCKLRCAYTRNENQSQGESFR